MARDHAQVNVAIWGDPDFRGLPWQAQHLYLMLWSSPGLSYCGSHDWRPGRLTGLAAGLTRECVEAAAATLAARWFMVVDHDTEEILLRSWLRFDGILKQPRMAVSALSAYSVIASPLIRSVVVSELHRIRDDHPGLAAWRDDRMIAALDHPRAEPKGWPTPDDPFGGSLTPGFTHSVTPPLTPDLGQAAGAVWGLPTPAPAPAPYSLLPAFADHPLREDPDADASGAQPKVSRRKPQTPLPASWMPTAKHAEYARQRGVDLMREAETFRVHAETHDRRVANWNSAFHQWLSKSNPTRPGEQRREERTPWGRTWKTGPDDE